jgi:tRNA pseudouridine38-40 synthase
MRNIRLTIEFDGTGYAGWQIQPGQPTIQGLIEQAAAKVFGTAITVYGCGRTDAGVSARNYVANCFCPAKLPVNRIPAALNHYLPEAVYVRQAEVVADDFHARYSARAKVYAYYIVCNRSPLRRRFAWEYTGPLNLSRLKSGTRFFIGTRDFSRFCFDRSENGVCTVSSITVRMRADELVITIRGDRFLYKMVRRIVGALVAYAGRRINAQDIRAALAGKRHRPFITAPARGLILEKVIY